PRREKNQAGTTKAKATRTQLGIKIIVLEYFIIINKIKDTLAKIFQEIISQWEPFSYSLLLSVYDLWPCGHYAVFFGNELVKDLVCANALILGKYQDEFAH